MPYRLVQNRQVYRNPGGGINDQKLGLSNKKNLIILKECCGIFDTQDHLTLIQTVRCVAAARTEDQQRYPVTGPQTGAGYRTAPIDGHAYLNDECGTLDVLRNKIG